MRVPDPRLSQAREVAQALTAGPTSVEHALGGGRNSRIFRVRCDAGEFALKQYPRRPFDPRDRVAAEIGALQLMECNGIDNVPRVIGFDRKRGFALLSWIDSSSVTYIADSDIDAAAGFLAQIHALRNSPLAKEQPLAAEACLSGIEIERQITKRLARLLRIPGERDLLVFLNRTFAPAFERERIQAKLKMQAADLDFTAKLPQELRSLVASDFGFHNSLRRRDGSLAFIDFEYFGWDDPVKLAADFLLHPGTALTTPQRLRFRRLAEHLYRDDRGFAARLDAYLVLFGLRWVLILLNEFIPDRWQQRVLAGASEAWVQAKATQLAHAVNFLAALREKVEG